MLVLVVGRLVRQERLDCASRRGLRQVGQERGKKTGIDESRIGIEGMDADHDFFDAVGVLIFLVSEEDMAGGLDLHAFERIVPESFLPAADIDHSDMLEGREAILDGPVEQKMFDEIARVGCPVRLDEQMLCGLVGKVSHGLEKLMNGIAADATAVHGHDQAVRQSKGRGIDGGVLVVVENNTRGESVGNQGGNETAEERRFPRAEKTCDE